MESIPLVGRKGEKELPFCVLGVVEDKDGHVFANSKMSGGRVAGEDLGWLW